MEATYVIEYMVNSIVKMYKAEKADVWEYISAELKKEKNLAKIIQDATELKFVIRTKEFKNIFVRLKKNIYHNLRTYKKNIDTVTFLDKEYAPETDKTIRIELLKNHISTKERMGENFYNQLMELVGQTSTLLDVGCGLNPLMIPDQFVKETIVGIDKDKNSIRVLDDYAKWSKNKKIIAVHWDIREGWRSVTEKSGIELFDFALIMKVVPVVNRQEPELLDILMTVPAKRILITGSKNSMTKNVSIYNREKSVIESFISQGQFIKEAALDSKEEFGWIIRRS